MAINASRRTFLKTGIAGAIVLATAGAVYRATADRTPMGKFVLDNEGKAALGAIASAMLQGALPATAQSVETAMQRTELAIAGLPLTTQKEIQDLFGLLTLAPSRRFLVGIPDGWSQAKPEHVSAFLENWRTHRIAMLQTAYHALHDLILGGWYADESTWASIGYPGPIKLMG